MKRRVWKHVLLFAPAQYHELLIAPLSSLGFNGFLQENESLSCFINSKDWSRTTEAALRRFLSRFRKEFPNIETRYVVRTVNERNWNAAWENSIDILEATDRIIVKPSWKKLRAKDRGKIVLHIDPKMSFGTGHHETTRLCLTLLQRHISPAANVLDVGTGTGILAIAAVKLGAQRVIAIDNDPWSIENARENITRNNVTRRVKLIRGDLQILSRKRFDVVLANIDYSTIALTLSKLVASVRRHGVLILSGLLTSDLDALFNLLRHRSVIPVELIDENEWSAIALVKI